MLGSLLTTLYSQSMSSTLHEEPCVFDFLIVGQGLAGSALAMALLKRGAKLAVLDDASVTGASRVAAGLVTTLAGMGMNPAWRQAEYWPRSLAYYRELEQKSGVPLFHAQPVLRLFGSEKEANKFSRKAEAVSEWVHDENPGIAPELLYADLGGFEMAQGGRLDTNAYLRVVRNELLAAGVKVIEAAFSEDELIDQEGTLLAENSDASAVSFRGMSAKRVILCQGARGLLGGHFSDIPHRSAKGEMLTVKVAGMPQDRIINRNGWMVPIGNDEWRAGATYEWDDLTPTPTDAGREAVLQKVANLSKLPAEFLSHQVGVRPIIRNSQPVIGLSPSQPNLGIFNGLGSKGVITAPCVAEHFADFLTGKISALDPDLDLSKLP